MNKLSIACCIGLALAGSQALASPAVLSSPTPYLAPGGTTYSGSGSATAAGGRTWTVSGFDNSAYDHLYYAVGDYTPSFDPAGPSLTFDGSRDVMSFNSSLSALASGLAVWTGSTSLFTYNFGWLPVSTRFTLTVTDLANAPLSLIGAGSVSGLPASLGAVLDVPGSFKANWRFEADAPYDAYGFRPSLALYDDPVYLTSSSYRHASSVGGAFYYTAPVPEPETYSLMLAGLGLLGLIAKRRKANA